MEWFGHELSASELMMPRRLAKQRLGLLGGEDGDGGDTGFTSTNDRDVILLLVLRRLRPAYNEQNIHRW